MTTTWHHRAVCRGVELFGAAAEEHRAKRICRHCPVARDCLAEALDFRIEHGVWGGKTARERRRMLRAHPDVGSWRDYFDSATGAGGPASLTPTSRRPSRS